MSIDYMAYAAQLARVQFQSAANILDVADQGRGTVPLQSSQTVGNSGEVSEASPLQVHAGLLIAEMELAVVRAELRAGTYAPIQERLERE